MFDSKVQERSTFLSGEVTSPSIVETEVEAEQAKRFDKLDGNKYQTAIFMSLAVMMGMIGGYGLGYVNNSWDVINALYGWETTQQKSLWDSLVGSVFSLGAGIGCSVAGKVMQFGRRRSMFLSCFVGIVGCSIQCFRSRSALIIGRLIYGLGTGISATATNRMIEEYVPFKYYQALSPIFSFSMNIGTLLAAFSATILPKSGASLQELQENETWRYIFGFPIVLFVLIILGLLLFVKTDTPKYYILQKDIPNAVKAVKAIYNCRDSLEVNQIIQMMQQNQQHTTSKVTLKQAFTDPEFSRCSWVNVTNIIFHELTGINVIFLYSNTILALVLTGNSFTPRQGVYAINIVNTLASGMAVWTVRKFGRRPLLIWGHAGICVCHLMIATFILESIDIGVLVMLCVFMLIYQNTSGPIAWIYAAETLTDVGLGVSLNVLYGTILVLSLTTEPLMNSALTPVGVFYMLAFFSFVAVFFLYFYFKETMGLTEKQKKSLYSPAAIKENSQVVEAEFDN